MIDHSLFFTATPAQLAAIDRTLALVAVNPAWTAVFGEAEGGSLLDLVVAEERERVAAEIAAVGPSEAMDVVAHVRTGDGTIRAFALRCARGVGDDAPIHVAARDRTREEALSAELDFVTRRIDALFNAMQDEVYLTDENGIIDGVARPPAGLPREAIIGTVMLNWSAPQERAAMEARYAEARRGSLVCYETVAQFPDGSTHFMSSRMGPILDGDRSVGTVLITRDVTQERLSEEAKKRAEQQVRDYMVQLERSNRELERFASVASHDLQEPLRKIQAFSDRLRDRFNADLPETARDYLSRMQDAAKRMQELINDLLMFSRLSVKKQTYTQVNLAKVLKTVLSDLEVRIEETGGKVHFGALPALEADPVHMRQLLQNMIGNALKFARTDVPPVVDISAEVVPSTLEDIPGSMVRLKITDNGIGIDPRYHDRIFGIFERLHGRGKYEGTGVGLAVCRKIVEQHHGSIGLSSVPGEGTTFTILLPVTQAERNQHS